MSADKRATRVHFVEDSADGMITVGNMKNPEEIANELNRLHYIHLNGISGIECENASRKIVAMVHQIVDALLDTADTLKAKDAAERDAEGLRGIIRGMKEVCASQQKGLRNLAGKVRHHRNAADRWHKESEYQKRKGQRSWDFAMEWLGLYCWTETLLEQAMTTGLEMVTDATSAAYRLDAEAEQLAERSVYWMTRALWAEKIADQAMAVGLEQVMDERLKADMAKQDYTELRAHHLALVRQTRDALQHAREHRTYDVHSCLVRAINLDAKYQAIASAGSIGAKSGQPTVGDSCRQDDGRCDGSCFGGKAGE
jgi:ElaB/YqjD/DUF883 family membrane-anchored ribosome-binding protein